MKKLVSLGILLIFMFLLGGQFVIYMIRLSENREFMKEAILNGSFKNSEIVFSIENNQNEIVIEGNEVSRQGHRYDIIKIEHKGNTTIIHAINDANEERLVAHLNDEYNNGISRQAPLNDHRSVQLLEDFFKEYLANIPLNLNTGSHISFIYDQLPVLSAKDGFIEFYVPPPDYIAA